jgi:magnesium and cobalt transporter
MRFFITNLLPWHGGSGTLREAVEEVLEEHEEEVSAINPTEKKLLRNTLEFSELDVGDILIPRAEVVAIPDTSTLAEIQTCVMETGHAWLPVYHDNVDDVTGYIQLKELVRYIGRESDFRLQDIVRDILVVPPSMRVSVLLLKMQRSDIQIALVVDEYGGMDGIVTLDDILECIVGDLEELPGNHVTMQVLSPDLVVTHARTEIDTLNELFGEPLHPETEETEFHTLGGLIFELTGYVPKRGEKIPHGSFIFTIEDADQRRIQRVRIERVKAA